MKISDNDLKIMYEISKDVHGDDEIEIIKGVLRLFFCSGQEGKMPTL